MAKHLGRLGLFGSVLLFTLSMVNPAGASTSVGPNQHFQGLINHSSGSSGRVEIQMGCFGPVKPGETGHPMTGQSITVRMATGTGGSFGETGSRTTSIGVYFGAPPPSTTGSSTSSVIFKKYRTVAMPTSLVLPCSGDGNVYFLPLPNLPPSEGTAAIVEVNYVGQP